MTYISADPASLHALAARIRAAAAEAHAAKAEPGPLLARFTQLGDPGLIRAGHAFVAAWTTPLADLVDDAHRLADAVDVVADTYQAIETGQAGR